jgi:hypothetical protein
MLNTTSTAPSRAGISRSEKSLSDVEAAQPRRHLLRHLGVDRLLVRSGGDPELREEDDVRKSDVPAHVEADDRARVDADDHQRPILRDFFQGGRLHGRAEATRAAIAGADAADAFLDGGEVQHVPALQLEGGEQLVAVEPGFARKAHVLDAREGPLVDTEL